MNGKVTRGAATLDYREVARPLTFRLLKEDVDALYAQDTKVERLVLWEHQVDWLEKAERGEPLEGREEWVAVDPGARCMGIFSFPKMPEARIWGIPVEIVHPLTERKFRAQVQAAYESLR